MYAHHPPEVVTMTISRSNTMTMSMEGTTDNINNNHSEMVGIDGMGTRTPDTATSPLASAPVSPRSQNTILTNTEGGNTGIAARAGGNGPSSSSLVDSGIGVGGSMFEVSACLLEELVRQNKEEAEAQEAAERRRKQLEQQQQQQEEEELEKRQEKYALPDESDETFDEARVGSARMKIESASFRDDAEQDESTFPSHSVRGTRIQEGTEDDDEEPGRLFVKTTNRNDEENEEEEPGRLPVKSFHVFPVSDVIENAMPSSPGYPDDEKKEIDTTDELIVGKTLKILSRNSNAIVPLREDESYSDDNEPPSLTAVEGIQPKDDLGTVLPQETENDRDESGLVSLKAATPTKELYSNDESNTTSSKTDDLLEARLQTPLTERITNNHSTDMMAMDSATTLPPVASASATFVTTPDPHLKSPPPLVKTTMAGHTAEVVEWNLNDIEQHADQMRSHRIETEEPSNEDENKLAAQFSKEDSSFSGDISKSKITPQLLIAKTNADKVHTAIQADSNSNESPPPESKVQHDEVGSQSTKDKDGGNSILPAASQKRAIDLQRNTEHHTMANKMSSMQIMRLDSDHGTTLMEDEEEIPQQHMMKPQITRSVSEPVDHLDMTTIAAMAFATKESEEETEAEALLSPAQNIWIEKNNDDAGGKPDLIERSASDVPNKSFLVTDWSKYLRDDPKLAATETKKKHTTVQRKYFPPYEQRKAWLKEERDRQQGSTLIETNIENATSDSTNRDEISRTHDQPGKTEDLDFALALSKALEGLPNSPIPSALKQHEMGLLSEDDEVAELTRHYVGSNSTSILSNKTSIENKNPKPRRLVYTAEESRSKSSKVPELNRNPVALKRNVSEEPFEARRSDDHQSRRNVEFRSLAVSTSIIDTGENSIEVTTSLRSEANRPKHALPNQIPANTQPNLSQAPVLVSSLDNHLGIAQGDITLSLLNEDENLSRPSQWGNSVYSAIWRCRQMRMDKARSPIIPISRPPGSPARGRSSLPVDIDQGRVAGGASNIRTTEEVAHGHLKHDEIDEALELFEDIIFSYYGYFNRSLDERDSNPGADGGAIDFQPYVGVAAHNMGILNLLKGDYREALTAFNRAVNNRKASLGVEHPDYLTSLVKLATCYFAINEYRDAHLKFEDALILARRNLTGLSDKMQLAEILNNLGCLAMMCKQPSTATIYLRESMDIQFAIMSESLYLSDASVGHTISLNVSITRANIGFAKMAMNELHVSVSAFENALMEQQLLLRGLNATLIATMEHLVSANLLVGQKDKAGMMYGRILEAQKREYGPQDARCLATISKINLIKSNDDQFLKFLANLKKYFVIESESVEAGTTTTEKTGSSPNPLESDVQHAKATKKTKKKTRNILSSIRKKKSENLVKK